ncbi:MAG: shikimate kinase [Elusimicrobiota bacterium]|nr:shikimate kinase [Elusimicrobiota bacterium]
MKNIYLTGFMCAGKTLAGRALARALRLPFCDSDALLEKKTGASLSALIKARGLGGFRRLEAELVRHLAARSGQVIALGGGVYPSRRWESLLKRTGVAVFLYCPWPELEVRLEAARAPRPLLSGSWKKAAPRAKKLYSARLRFYRRADITINTAGLTPAQTAEKTKKALNKIAEFTAETQRSQSGV